MHYPDLQDFWMAFTGVRNVQKKVKPGGSWFGAVFLPEGFFGAVFLV